METPAESPETAKVNKYFRELPAGYSFRPTDEELLVHYLMNKVANKPMPLHRIKTFNIYKCHPCELSSRGYDMIREKDLYFFTPRIKKYQNGRRPDRRAGNGVWKATGIDFPVKNRNGVVVGYKMALVYHEVKSKGKTVKTNWLMHEYTLHKKRSNPEVTKNHHGDNNNNLLDECVLVKIYLNSRGKKGNNSSPLQEGSEQIPADEANKDEIILEKTELFPVVQAEPQTLPVVPNYPQVMMAPYTTTFHHQNPIGNHHELWNIQNRDVTTDHYYYGNNFQAGDELWVNSNTQNGSLLQEDQYYYNCSDVGSSSSTNSIAPPGDYWKSVYFGDDDPSVAALPSSLDTANFDGHDEIGQCYCGGQNGPARFEG